MSGAMMKAEPAVFVVLPSVAQARRQFLRVPWSTRAARSIPRLSLRALASLIPACVELNACADKSSIRTGLSDDFTFECQSRPSVPLGSSSTAKQRNADWDRRWPLDPGGMMIRILRGRKRHTRNRGDHHPFQAKDNGVRPGYILNISVNHVHVNRKPVGGR